MLNTQSKTKHSHFRSWKSGKSWLFAATLFAVLAGTSMLTSASAVKVQAASTSSLVSVIRMYNPKTGEHLLSTDPNEQKVLTANGWKNEGVNFVEPTSGVSVHRLYNPTTGAHLYSGDTTEIAHLAANGWNDEGNDFYAPSSGAYPVVRLYNPTTNQHVWSTDPHEQSVLTSGGAWKAEGTAFYAESYALPSVSYATLASELSSAFAQYGAKVYVNTITGVGYSLKEIDVATEDPTVIAAFNASSPTEAQTALIQDIKNTFILYGKQLVFADDRIAFNPVAGILSSNFNSNLPGFSQNSPLTIDGTGSLYLQGTTQNVATGINLAQILQGNFNSLNGTWTNGDGQTFTFTNGKLNSPGAVVTAYLINGSVVLSVGSANGIGGFAILPYPAGAKITGLTDANGKIDQTGSADTTDQTQDRLLAGQDMPVYGTLNQEVYYKTN